MIWVALIFTVTIVAYGIRQKVTLREWLLKVVLLLFSLLGSGIVSFNLWPKTDILFWVRDLFEPVTKWIYAIL
ncbi:hypothetical protein [Alicyclobacillus mengziensis]|uniref:Uncharacterized protein n=1 Tax=Alicyclobacillus mengziensis TaxID=2931921 RepID=A0A9X7VWJ9_9BACL|nr:hypothetical protein [Alicyclobacillus mengziensis]QSO45837.1 hypothetical protein JZ786_14965 [Alicyclobacillus mengziensis]